MPVSGAKQKPATLFGKIFAAAFLFALIAATPDTAFSAGEQYGIPDAEEVKATQGEVDELDRETQAIIDILRNGSPTAVEYSERAHGALIFPKVESSSFIIGGSSALGVLYAKNDGGEYEKAGYWRAERASIGLQVGSSSSSSVFMFMNDGKLEQFRQGKLVKFGADASFMQVDPLTGKISGKEDADIAVFTMNQEGSSTNLKMQNLKIDPIKIVQ